MYTHFDNCGRCKGCKNSERCVREIRNDLVNTIAESRIADLDTATLIELSLDARESLDATIARMERIERKRLAKLRTEKLWQLHEEIT